MKEVIAKCRSTRLGWEDHGILTVAIDFDYGGSSQGIPARALDSPYEADDGGFIGRFGTARGMEYVARIMRAFGVECWEDIRGRTVLALTVNGMIVGIKPLPTERGREFIFATMSEPGFIPGVERR